ncbi:hypothetical protein KKG56_00560 [bacterium]|nr:hypothetical protein [bacterium]
MGMYSKIVKYGLYLFWAFKDKSNRFKYWKELEESQWWSFERIKELQWQRMKNLLSHAYQNVSYYKMIFDKVGLTLKDITSFEDWKKLPFLEKDNIKNNLEMLIARNYKREDLLKNGSGGSTGSPVIFYEDKNKTDWRLAAPVRHNRWCGWDIGERQGCIWGAPRDLVEFGNIKAKLRNLVLDRVLILNAYELKDESMYKFAMKLKRCQPTMILAYANALYLFAKFLKDNKIEGIKPIGIISTGEVLYPERRELIESVFNCKVFNRYGSREVGLVASECSEHKGMHVNAENVYVEFVKKDGTPALYGEMGEIVVTDLCNYATPLIRYKIGDVGSPSGEICPCGRGLPLMEMIEGRTSDFIVTPENKFISGPGLSPLIMDLTGIKQLQFVQKEKGKVIIKIVKDDAFQEEEIRMLRSRLQKYTGEIMQIMFEFVDDIPKKQSGKQQLIISDISMKELSRTKGNEQ